MTADPFSLWQQAGGGTRHYSRERYRDLLIEHGHILRPGDEGYEQGSRTLPCGWPGPAREDRCEVTELIVSQCSHCTGRGEEIPDKPDPAKRGPWFESRYPGKCVSCGERWPTGDQIRSDGDGGYLCGSCGDDDG